MSALVMGEDGIYLVLQYRQHTPNGSDSRRFFQIVLSISECLSENSSLNYELDGFCPVQIGCVEAEISNLKEDLHTKSFLILYNRKSGRVSHQYSATSNNRTLVHGD